MNRPVRFVPSRWPRWKRLSPPGRKVGALWEHVSGWTVEHCGHPTALYPYSATDPAEPDTMVIDSNGKGFGDLTRAFGRVEAYLRGDLDSATTRSRYGRVRLLRDRAEVPS